MQKPTNTIKPHALKAIHEKIVYWKKEAKVEFLLQT
jgi:hypothetical protein